MLTIDAVRFPNLLALTRFMTKLTQFAEKQLGEELGKGLTGLYLEMLTDTTLNTLVNSMSRPELEWPSPTPFDEDVSALVKSKRHSRYVKMLVRCGITSKDAAKFIAAWSPTSRVHYLQAPSDDTDLDMTSNYNVALAVSLRDGNAAHRASSLLDTPIVEASYWAVFKNLGWPLLTDPSDSPGAPIFTTPMNGAQIPIFQLEWLKVPFIEPDQETSDLLDCIKQYVEDFNLTTAFVLWCEPQTMFVGGRIYVSPGLMLVDGTWGDFLVNDLCRSPSELLDLHKLVSDQPERLEMLEDRNMQVLGWFAKVNLEIDGARLAAMRLAAEQNEPLWMVLDKAGFIDAEAALRKVTVGTPSFRPSQNSARG